MHAHIHVCVRVYVWALFGLTALLPSQGEREYMYKYVYYNKSVLVKSSRLGDTL